jgi:hypothetical protein
MSQNNSTILIAIEGETQAEYNKRNLKKGTAKCLHNYDGQDNLRTKRCNFCKCVLYTSSNILNYSYTIYRDDYL